MTHITPDFQTKKAFKEAVKSGKEIIVMGGFMLQERILNGTATIEAPANYHKWYASIELIDGKIVKVK